MDHNLSELRIACKGCKRCQLRSHATQVVPSVGPSNAKLMLVGEGPGADEDLLGEPFVGASGQLLDKILYSAGIKRDEVIISNVVRCRPPNNRTPLPAEINACKGWLWKEIKLIKPLVVVALGKTAARLLLVQNDSFKISQHIGKCYQVDYMKEWGGVVVPIYHPSFLLRGGMAEVERTVKLFIMYRKRLHFLEQQANAIQSDRSL